MRVYILELILVFLFGVYLAHSCSHLEIGYIPDNLCGEPDMRSYANLRMQSLPEDGILFNRSGWFSDMYMQYVENRRPDVDMLFWYAVGQDNQLRVAVDKERYPRVEFPTDLGQYDREHKVLAITQRNIRAGRPVFWDYSSHGIVNHLWPVGMFYQVIPEDIGELSPQMVDAVHRNAEMVFNTAIKCSEPLDDYAEEGRREWATIFAVFGDYFWERRMDEDALKLYLMAYELYPGFYEVVTMVGELNYHLGRIEEARKWFREAIEVCPWRDEAKKQLRRVENDEN